MFERYKYTYIISFFIILAVTKIAWAEDKSVSLKVTCQVVKHHCPVKIENGVSQKSPEDCPVNTDKSILLDEVKFVCPEGGSVQTVVSYSKTNSNGEEQAFYKNANCTEVWEPEKVNQFYSNTHDKVISQKIYCKKPVNAEESSYVKSSIEVTFTLDY